MLREQGALCVDASRGDIPLHCDVEGVESNRLADSVAKGLEYSMMRKKIVSRRHGERQALYIHLKVYG